MISNSHAGEASDADARDDWVAERLPDALAERPLQDSAVVLRDLRALWEHRRRHAETIAQARREGAAEALEQASRHVYAEALGPWLRERAAALRDDA